MTTSSDERIDEDTRDEHDTDDLEEIAEVVCPGRVGVAGQSRRNPLDGGSNYHQLYDRKKGKELVAPGL